MYKMGTISNEYPFFPVALLKSFLIPWRFISFMKNEFLPLVYYCCDPRGYYLIVSKRVPESKIFSSFLAKVLPYSAKLRSPSFGASSTVKNNQIRQTFWGKMKKCLFKLWVVTKNWISGTYHATKPKSLQNRGHRRCITK